MSKAADAKSAVSVRSTTPRTRLKPMEKAPSNSAERPNSPPAEAPKGKLGILVALLRDPGGATVDAMAAATGWQVHSVRGAISGSLKKGLGLNVVSEKTASGRIYHIVDGAGA